MGDSQETHGIKGRGRNRVGDGYVKVIQEAEKGGRIEGSSAEIGQGGAESCRKNNDLEERMTRRKKEAENFGLVLFLTGTSDGIWQSGTDSGHAGWPEKGVRIVTVYTYIPIKRTHLMIILFAD